VTRQLRRQGISIQEAARLLGVTSREQIYRAIKSGHLKIAEGSGTQDQPYRLVREGLEEAWANRPLKMVRTARTEKGRAEKERARAIREGSPPVLDELAADELPSVDGLPKAPRGKPNLEDEKAWVEYERRYKLKLENMKEEGLLVYREDYDRANMAVLAQLKLRVERIAPLLRVRMPGLDITIFEEVERLTREALEGVASPDYSEEAE